MFLLPSTFLGPQGREMLNAGIWPDLLLSHLGMRMRLHTQHLRPGLGGRGSPGLSVRLSRVLESEEGRREYLAFPTSKSPGAGQKGRKDLLKGNGRRIDYMLYTEEGLCPDWKAVSLGPGGQPGHAWRGDPVPCSPQQHWACL